MTRTCENCRRPVLDSDTVCWHCGWKLPPIVTEAADEPAESVFEEEEDTPIDPTPLPLTIFYGGLTLLIIIALIWLMNVMAQSPTVIGLSQQTGDFVLLQDPQQRFSISIPANWHWNFQGDFEKDPDSSSSIEDGRWFSQASAPLGTLVADDEQVFQAGNDSVLMVITTSEQLNQLTGEQIVASLRQESFEDLLVQDARLARNSAGDIVALYNVIHETPDLHCRQLWTTGAENAYLVSACTAASDAGTYQNEIDITLDSFRVSNR